MRKIVSSLAVLAIMGAVPAFAEEPAKTEAPAAAPAEKAPAKTTTKKHTAKKKSTKAKAEKAESKPEAAPAAPATK